MLCDAERRLCITNEDKVDWCEHQIEECGLGNIHFVGGRGGDSVVTSIADHRECD